MRLAPARLFGLTALLVAALLPQFAHSQLGVYGTVVATRVNNPSSAQSISFGGTNTGYWTTGFGVGAYYDALHIGPISLGLDLRGSGAGKAKVGQGGVRLAVHPPILPLKPYVEMLAGVANTVNIYNATSSDFFYQVVGGVDYTLIPHLDLRAIEIGGARVPSIISTAPTGTRSMLNISSGIAIHF